MRLIDGDALKRKLLRIAEKVKPNESPYVMVALLLENTVEVPTIEIGAWIPVDERLPELEDDSEVSTRGEYRSYPVAVTFKSYFDNKTPITADRLAVLREDGKWYWDESGDGDFEEESLVEITAWMPLPGKPYQEVETDGRTESLRNL